MAYLKGLKQVKLETYLAAVSAGTATDYLWLVREFSGDTVVSSAIYYGERKYADVSSNVSDARVDNILAALGGIVDENGNWIGFLPTHQILGDSAITSNEEALIALEDAILNNLALINGKVSQEDYENTIAFLESAITYNEDAISALSTEVDKKANKTDVYTKEEIDAKIAGAFHFKGIASGISDDETTIYGEDAGDGIVASEDNIGDVYQIGNKEYASNGTKWVELGFDVDLTPIFAKLNELQSALTEEVEAREALQEDVTELSQSVDELDEVLNTEVEKVGNLESAVSILEKGTTVSAETYSDAEQITGIPYGKIIYVTTDEPGETGHTAGPYINTPSGLQRIESSNGEGESVEERVENLESIVGDTELPSGDTLTAIVMGLITVDGDDF